MTGAWKLEIVKRSDLHRFVALPKRWVVERTFAWISRNRRLARDFERHARKAAAFIRLVTCEIYTVGVAAKGRLFASPEDAVAELDVVWNDHFPIPDCETCVRFRELGRVGHETKYGGRS